MFPRALVLSCVLALGLAGCGRADDERTVSAVTERFLRAVSDGDGERACAQLSDGAREALEHDESKPCAEAAPDIDGIEASAVTRAQVFATDREGRSRRRPQRVLELTAAAGGSPRRAAARRAATTLQVRGRGLMRAIFVAYLVVIVAGLVYFTALGLWSL